MNEPTSYYLDDDWNSKIFVYTSSGDTVLPPHKQWYIAILRKRGKNISRFKSQEIPKFQTEEEAKVELHRYAREHNLRPAY